MSGLVQFLPQPEGPGPQRPSPRSDPRPSVRLILQPLPDAAPRGHNRLRLGCTLTFAVVSLFLGLWALGGGCWPDAERDSRQHSGNTCSSSYTCSSSCTWCCLSFRLHSNGMGGATGVA